MSVHCPQVLAKRRNACPDLEAFACSISSLLGAWSHMGAAFMASSSAAHVVVASIPCTDAPPSGRGAPSLRAHLLIWARGAGRLPRASSPLS